MIASSRDTPFRAALAPAPELRRIIPCGCLVPFDECAGFVALFTSFYTLNYTQTRELHHTFTIPGTTGPTVGIGDILSESPATAGKLAEASVHMRSQKPAREQPESTSRSGLITGIAGLVMRS